MKYLFSPSVSRYIGPQMSLLISSRGLEGTNVDAEGKNYLCCFHATLSQHTGSGISRLGRPLSTLWLDSRDIELKFKCMNLKSSMPAPCRFSVFDKIHRVVVVEQREREEIAR